MRAVIPSVSVKGFQAVLTCLTKVGDDIIVEARPDRFTMSTINITRSAFANFTFTKNFFESYHLDTTAEAIQHDAEGPYLRCSVLAKALVSACKIRGNVEQKIEKCCLSMNSAEGVGENCRLTVENIFKHGFIKVHKLLYESCPEPLQVLDSIESCSSCWRLPPVAMIGFTDNFSAKAEEISMTCERDTVTFKTIQDKEAEVSKRIGTTVIPMNKNIMEVYNLQDEIELTFSMKEFKAIIAFAVTLRLPLNGYFDARSRPFLLSVVSEDILTANFALATVIDDNDIQERSASEQAGVQKAINGENANHAHPEIDLSQPENALFLDDDADWAGALDDLEMEEAATAKLPQQQNGNTTNRTMNGQTSNTRTGAGSNTASTSRASTNRTSTSRAADGGAYEIEEGFLPAVTQRQSKRARFNFDDDDDDD